MKIGLMQPNYLPWRGYFDLIKKVDHFVFYDNVQYTKKNWRNRNFINGVNGLCRLSVPVIARADSLINEVRIDNSKLWAFKHSRSIEINYKKTKYFDNYFEGINDFIFKQKWEMLNDLNIQSTIYLCKLLGIKTEFHKASDYPFSGSKDGSKIIEFCKFFNCNTLVNGPLAKNYVDNELFEKAGISLEYIDYNYPVYVVPRNVTYNLNCSVLDLIFNCGSEAVKYFSLE